MTKGTSSGEGGAPRDSRCVNAHAQKRTCRGRQVCCHLAPSLRVTAAKRGRRRGGGGSLLCNLCPSQGVERGPACWGGSESEAINYPLAAAQTGRGEPAFPKGPFEHQETKLKSQRTEEESRDGGGVGCSAPALLPPTQKNLRLAATSRTDCREVQLPLKFNRNPFSSVSQEQPPSDCSSRQGDKASSGITLRR